MAEAIVRRGRGFSQDAHPSSSDNALRLQRPVYSDEEDREKIVLTGRRKPVSQGTHRRTPNFSPSGASGGVKLGSPPSTPASTGPQTQEAESPKPKRVKPGFGEVYSPRLRREPVSPEQKEAINKFNVKKTDVSGLDFSRMTRATHVQTLEQALKSQLNSDIKLNEQASPLNDPESTAGRPAELKAPRAIPVQTKVLVEALKSLPRGASPNRDPRGAEISQTPATVMPVAEAARQEVLDIPEITQHEELTMSNSFQTSAVVKEETPQNHQPSIGHSSGVPAVAKGEISHQDERIIVQSFETSAVSTSTADEVEGSVPSTDNMVSAEEFESYQLRADERFASESSDESESVTSTIHDYDNVSENEAASGDEIVQKKTSKPKLVEMSDGNVYYPVSVDEEPYVPLTYEIPTKELTRLMSLNDDSKLKFWSHELYQHEEKKITVETCTNLEEIETAAQKFINEKVIGFDMEWLPRPSKRVYDNVSLIQLAKEDHIALFHLARMKKDKVEELIPASLRAILESKDILKVGVSVAGDGSRIKKWLGIEPQGLMELSAIHHVLEFSRERRKGQIPRVLVSLTRLSEKYLQLPISKGSVRISDWTRPLSAKQISYAATDAYAGLRIFDALQQARMLIDPMPMLPACVKCGDDKKKRGVVTPKLYIDGVEAGKTSVSTWNTSFEATVATTQTNGSSTVIDWAQEVEESRVEFGVAAPAPKARSSRKKSSSTNSGEVSNNGQSSAKKAAKPVLPPPSPEVQFAINWGKQHQAERTVGDSKLASLRAYALWHLKAYTVEDTAKHLGIEISTAAQYICQAVRADRLEHDRDEFKIVQNLNPRHSYRGARRF